MAVQLASTYDKMNRPYNSSMQRSVFSPSTENIPGITQEEGGRTIKTGGALTDVWIDTWIKSRTYQPKSQGFFLDSKSGSIECGDIISTGNMQVLSGVIIVGTTVFTPQSITYKNGSGANTTKIFLVA